MTDAQARQLARQIFDKFDKQIVEATTGTAIQPAFIAGLVGNEAGKNRAGEIVRQATRFEPHVYRALVSIRDNGYRMSNGRRVNHYNKIIQADIRDASDLAIRALATSYEATQIMGWHVVKNLHCTIADLRNPDKHFFYTVKLLQLHGYVRSLTEIEMDREMREWNTGSEVGRTYHPNYVPSARKLREAYRELEKTRSHRRVPERVNVTEADLINSTGGVVYERFDEVSSAEIEAAVDELQAAGPVAKPFSDPQEALPHERTEAAETPQPPALQTPVVVEVEAPPPTGMMAKLKAQLAAMFAFIGGGAGLKEYLGVQLSEQTVTLLKYIVPTVLVLGFIGLIVWYVSEKIIGWKTLRLQAEIATDPERPNLKIRPQ